MARAARVGDLAGGAIQNSRGVQVTIDGIPVAVAGDAVAAHPPCPDSPAHCAASTTASALVTVDGIPVVLDGDPATCGHGAQASALVTIE